MRASTPRSHDLEISGLSALVGRILSMEEWAERLRIPDQKTEGILSGKRITEILGVEGKSWDPDLFGEPSTIAAVAKAALASARLKASDVEALIVVTCTPYEIMLGQDGFRLARDLKLNDDVPAIQLEAGCGGLGRAMSVAASMASRTTLVVAYNVVSPIVERRGPNPLYQQNDIHPLGRLTWASGALFSDGAAAMVLRRTGEASGLWFYSRDQQAFGDRPGFEDPIVHYPGGGALFPPGYPDHEGRTCFAMSGKIIADYYNTGMVLNHQTLLRARPGYVEEVKRIYSHQAGPALVRSFVELAKVPADKVPTSAARLGNLVGPCTLHLMHEDIEAGVLRPGDEVCVSVIGAGPERGAFLARNQGRDRAPVSLPITRTVAYKPLRVARWTQRHRMGISIRLVPTPCTRPSGCSFPGSETTSAAPAYSRTIAIHPSRIPSKSSAKSEGKPCTMNVADEGPRGTTSADPNEKYWCHTRGMKLIAEWGDVSFNRNL